MINGVWVLVYVAYFRWSSCNWSPIGDHVVLKSYCLIVWHELNITSLCLILQMRSLSLLFVLGYFIHTTECPCKQFMCSPLKDHLLTFSVILFILLSPQRGEVDELLVLLTILVLRFNLFKNSWRYLSNNCRPLKVKVLFLIRNTIKMGEEDF